MWRRVEIDMQLWWSMYSIEHLNRALKRKVKGTSWWRKRYDSLIVVHSSPKQVFRWDGKTLLMRAAANWGLLRGEWGLYNLFCKDLMWSQWRNVLNMISYQPYCSEGHVLNGNQVMVWGFQGKVAVIVGETGKTGRMRSKENICALCSKNQYVKSFSACRRKYK